MAHLVAFALLFAVLAGPAAAQSGPGLVRSGTAALNAGAYEEAAGAFALAVPLFEQAEGPESLAVAGVLARLANAYGELGRYADAIPPAERALGIVDATIGRDDRASAYALATLALLLRSSDPKRHETLFAHVADPMAWRALDLIELIPGPDTAEVGRLLNGYAHLLHDAARDVEGSDFEARLERLGVTEAALLPEP